MDASAPSVEPSTAETTPGRSPQFWTRIVVLALLALGAVVLVALAIGEIEPLTGDPRIRSAAMFVPGPGPGPDIIEKGVSRTEFAPLQRFGVKIRYVEPTETLSITSVGAVTVTHVDQPATSQGYAGCCFTAPPTPGRYNLVIRARVASGTEFTYQLPYTVTPPP